MMPRVVETERPALRQIPDFQAPPTSSDATPEMQAMAGGRYVRTFSKFRSQDVLSDEFTTWFFSPKTLQLEELDSIPPLANGQPRRGIVWRGPLRSHVLNLFLAGRGPTNEPNINLDPHNVAPGATRPLPAIREDTHLRKRDILYTASQRHAEIICPAGPKGWLKNGTIYIMDVESSLNTVISRPEAHDNNKSSTTLTTWVPHPLQLSVFTSEGLVNPPEGHEVVRFGEAEYLFAQAEPPQDKLVTPPSPETPVLYMIELIPSTI